MVKYWVVHKCNFNIVGLAQAHPITMFYNCMEVVSTSVLCVEMKALLNEKLLRFIFFPRIAILYILVVKLY